jgi:hypothetical protein
MALAGNSTWLLCLQGVSEKIDLLRLLSGGQMFSRQKNLLLSGVQS